VNELDRLAQVVGDSGWLTRVIQTNTDRAVMDLLDAARAVVDSTPQQLPLAVYESLPLVRFHVMGVPAPKGSKTAMPNGRLIEGSSPAGRARLRDWTSATVSEASRCALSLSGPIDSPVRLQAVFRLPMPRSRPKWMRARGEYPSTVKPDLDKLIRSLGDSMVAAGLLRDDNLICDLGGTRKIEVIGWTGVDVRLYCAAETNT